MPELTTLNELGLDLALTEMTYFDGIDDRAVYSIREMIQDAQSAREIDDIVDQIDALIDDANRVWTPANGTHVLTSMIPAIGSFLLIARTINRMTNDRDRARFRETLNALRAEARAKKFR